MEDHPLTQDADGGGPVLMYSHLELFAHSGVAFTLALLQRGYGSLGFERYTETDPETWERVRGWCEAHHLIRIPKAPVRRSARLKHFLLSLRDPGRYLFSDITPEVVKRFRRLVSESGADLIWAENLFAGVLATHAQSDVPVVFSHHDRIFKLIRNWGANTASGWRHRYDSWTGDRLETLIIRRAIACASGSAVEARDLGRLNGRPVVYLPTTYPRLPESPAEEIPETARIVHLGGMNTVANRRGLERFLAVCWPHLQKSNGKAPELWVVGDLTGAPDSLHAELERSGAVRTGFVRDLSEVLRPGDIHIVALGACDGDPHADPRHPPPRPGPPVDPRGGGLSPRAARWRGLRARGRSDGDGHAGPDASGGSEEARAPGPCGGALLRAALRPGIRAAPIRRFPGPGRLRASGASGSVRPPVRAGVDRFLRAPQEDLRAPASRETRK